MNGSKAAFTAFLNGLGLPEPDAILARFEEFHTLLLAKNKQVNLFSRATPDEELWTKHFLDSLVPLKCIDFKGKKVLDFGSGGGLPGIPLKLAVPDCRMTLLDSLHKKAAAMRDLVGRLALTECQVVCSRLEEYEIGSDFDLILCRAVRLEERYLRHLFRLLADSGRVIFYKAQELEDIAGFAPELLYQEDFDYGSRSIYALNRMQLKR